MTPVNELRQCISLIDMFEREGRHKYFYWFVRSFVRSFVRLFIHFQFIGKSFIYLFVHFRCCFLQLFAIVVSQLLPRPVSSNFHFFNLSFFCFCFVLFCFLSFLMCYLLLMDTTQTELSVCRPSKNLFHLLGSSSLHINSPDSRRHHRPYHVFPSAWIGENKSQALTKTQTKI